MRDWGDDEFFDFLSVCAQKKGAQVFCFGRQVNDRKVKNKISGSVKKQIYNPVARAKINKFFCSFLM